MSKLSKTEIYLDKIKATSQDVKTIMQKIMIVLGDLRVFWALISINICFIKLIKHLMNKQWNKRS